MKNGRPRTDRAPTASALGLSAAPSKGRITTGLSSDWRFRAAVKSRPHGPSGEPRGTDSLQSRGFAPQRSPSGGPDNYIVWGVF